MQIPYYYGMLYMQIPYYHVVHMKACTPLQAQRNQRSHDDREAATPIKVPAAVRPLDPIHVALRGRRRGSRHGPSTTAEDSAGSRDQRLPGSLVDHRSSGSWAPDPSLHPTDSYGSPEPLSPSLTIGSDKAKEEHILAAVRQIRIIARIDPQTLYI